MANVVNGWVLHHKDPSWKTEDPERYANWNIEDLESMTISEHIKLHKPSIETKIKMSKSHIGNKHSKETRIKISISNTGKKHTEETKLHLSEIRKGISPSNKGNLCWNNGVKQKYCKNCPGEGWERGGLKRVN